VCVECVTSKVQIRSGVLARNVAWVDRAVLKHVYCKMRLSKVCKPP
jgi:hypothetical protein